MPGENFSRRVARAAAVGGGRGYRRQTPLSWYGIVFVICVLGIALIAYSRYEANRPAATVKPKPVIPPTTSNLWKVGLELDICGKLTKLPPSTSPGAFTTDGTGVVTIEPSLAAVPAGATGKNAVLNAFLVPNGISLTNTNLTVAPPRPPSTTTTTTTVPSKGSTTTGPTSTTTSTTTTTTTLPASRTYSNGQSCAGGKGIVQTEVWQSPSAKRGKIYTKNASTIRFRNGQLFTIAFVPKGTVIPKPTSAKAIAQYLIANPAGVSAGATGVAPPTSPVVVPSSTTTTTTAKSSKSASSSKG